MSKDYANLKNDLFDQINDFRNSLLTCDFINKKTTDYHKKWLNQIIKLGKKFDNTGDELVNNRKKDK
jgi:hypothetical protein